MVQDNNRLDKEVPQRISGRQLHARLPDCYFVDSEAVSLVDKTVYYVVKVNIKTTIID